MKLGKNFVIYTLSSIASGTLPLGLMPFLTNRLDPSQYGILATLTTMSLLLWPIVNWSITSYIGVKFFSSGRDNFPETFSSVLLLPLFMSIILITIFFCFRYQIGELLSIPPQWSVVIPFMAGSMLMPQVAQAVFAMRNQPIFYAAFEISGALINFFGTIAFVIALRLAWEGRIMAALLASTALSTIAFVYFRKGGLLVWQVARDPVSAAVRFGMGAMTNELAMQAMRQGDRILIVILIGQTTMGKYAVALQWSSILLTVLTAFGRAWSPFLFSSLSKTRKDLDKAIVRQTYTVWTLLFLAFLSFNLVTPLGYRLLINERYHDSVGVVFWITLGYLFTGVYLTLVDYILYTKKTHVLAYITIINLVVNLTLASYMIKRYGAIGAAMAFAITMGIIMCLTFATSRKIHPMPWTLELFR